MTRQSRAIASPGTGSAGARTRSHAHGVRHGRFLVHLVVVVLALSAVGFASQVPRSTSAGSRIAMPTYSLSGVAGTVDTSASQHTLRANGSLRTLASVALLTSQPDIASVRSAGGVSPASSVSAGVTVAAANSGVLGAGVTALADIVDPLRPFQIWVTGPNDTISSIAANYGISPQTIMENNPTVEDPDIIPEGLELIVPLADGILHKVGQGETLQTIVDQYDNITYETARSFRANGIADPDNLEVGAFVLLPGATVKPPPPPPPPPPPVPTPAAPSAGGGTSGGGTPPPPSGGRFSNPLGAYLGVSDAFGTPRGGSYHTGIDLDLWGYWNSPIYSACNGVVSRTEWLTYSYGYYVVVDCGDGWTTLYAHMSRIDVSVGQPVSQGTMLGLSGVTGFTTGEHLHFEIRLNGAPVNPAAYIAF